MQLAEGVSVALRSLRTYKLRTFLTILGNIVAVTSVIAVVSLIDGMDLFVRREIAEEGSNVLTLRRVDELQALTHLEEFLESLHNPKITLADYRALREAHIPFVTRMAAFDRAGGRADRHGRGIREIAVEGWTAEYPFFQDRALAAGRHFNTFEEKASRPVAVIGSTVAEKLFRGREPIGETIRVNGRHLQVVGVLEEQAGFLGHDPNLVVLTPLGRFLKIFGGRRSIAVRLQVGQMGKLDEARDRVRMHMRIRHRLKPSEKDDFAVTSSERIVELWKSISRAIFTALIVLVSLSLVVGGVVIMNIMLVSVTERTSEVGTRKALGARRLDILWQFLVESVTLSMIGGVLGIIFGFLLASAISLLTPLPYAIQPWSIAAGLIVTLVVGVFFGLYPANRAAGLDPVEALRYE